MPLTVMLLDDAIKDIEAIYRYIRNSENRQAVVEMVETLRAACQTLSENPGRGHIPEGFSRSVRFEYRQIIMKNYRIIYQVAPPNVFILGIIHGNRDIGDVLRQRLL
jgi:toxin ParE1/3/4